MKLGMNLLLWTASAGEEHMKLLEDIKSWGFDGVEFPMFAHDASPWKDLGAACDNLGLERTCVVVLPEGANLIGDDAGERQQAVDFLKGCVDTCDTLGATAIGGPLYSPVGRLVGRGPSEEEFARAVEGFKAVGEHAQQASVSICIEALNRFETYFLNCMKDASALVDAVGIPCVGHMYDTFHANIEEKNITEAITTAGKRINHVHISANDRGTPGEDHVAYDETLKALKRIGYDDWLTIEAFGSWLPELAGATCMWRPVAPSADHTAREGARFTREAWEKA
jgi:D-psicose/D-tagatose/L-ribulose 3-epimerase